MQTIRIAVTVSLEAAIGAGRSEYGDASVGLDAESVRGLTQEAKALLASATVKNDDLYLTVDRLAVASATSADTVAAIEALATEKAASLARWQEKRAGQRVRAIEKLLGRTDDQWFVTNRETGEPILLVDYPDLAADPRVAARRASLKPELERRFRAWQATSAQAARDAEAVRLENERLAPAAREAAKAYAAERVPQLTEALEQGYDVTAGVTDHIMREVAAAVRAEDLEILAQLVAGFPEYAQAEWDERTSPRPGAFAVKEALEEEIAAIAVPAGWSLSVSRIQRFRHCTKRKCTCSNQGCDACQPRTAVVVTLKSPIIADHVLVVEAE